MAGEIISELRSELHNRTTNPYFFCFLTALCFYHYKLFLIVFSSEKLNTKLCLISDSINLMTWHDFVLPLAYALLAYLFIAASSFSKLGWEYVNVRVGNAIIYIKKEQHISMSLYRKTLTEIDQLNDEAVRLRDLNKKLVEDEETYRIKHMNLTKKNLKLDYDTIFENKELIEKYISITKDFNLDPDAALAVLHRLASEVRPISVKITPDNKIEITGL